MKLLSVLMGINKSHLSQEGVVHQIFLYVTHSICSVFSNVNVMPKRPPCGTFAEGFGHFIYREETARVGTDSSFLGAF